MMVARFSQLQQSWNGAAVLALIRVYVNPALALPHARLPHIGRLDAAKLRALGVRGVLLDKDNTVTAPYVNL